MVYLIQGFISSNAPIHIADGEDKNNDGKFVATSRTRIVVDGKSQQIPVIKSGTFRGGLRRAASDLILEACHAHGVRMNAATLNTLRHGATNAAITRDEARSSDYKDFYGNPHMGIFGGGPIMGQGFLQIGRLYPVCAETLAKGLVPTSEYDNELKAWALVEVTKSFSKIDMVKAPDDRFSEFAADLDEATDNILAADLGRRVKRDTKAEPTAPEAEALPDSKLRSANIIAYQAILPGVDFYLDLALRPAPSGRPKDFHAGYLIEALCNFFNNHRVGGIVREGFGTFNLNGIAQNVTINDAPLFELHKKTLIPAAGLAEELVDAYHAWARNGKAWSVEELSRATGIAVAKRGRPMKEAA